MKQCRPREINVTCSPPFVIPSFKSADVSTYPGRVVKTGKAKMGSGWESAREWNKKLLVT